jgi:N6-L-threonylcarbamoyladenine synthase
VSPAGDGRLILAVETSCDDTCVAVVSWDGEILANVISSQGIHDRYGGVVPEIASRHHLQLLDPALREALSMADVSLDDIELVAATQGPGLVAALLVGFSAAKALAASRQLSFAPVDHLHGHIAASFLRPEPFPPPFLALLASGGHTLLADVRDHGPAWRVLGQTLDDAAGEAFDKGARLLGLGYPGGPALQKLAADGDPQAVDFPTGRRMAGLDFSFAGLKTALLYKIRDLGETEARRQAADLAASYQRAIVEALTIRVKRALQQTGHTRLAVGGGVAANGPLREAMAGLGVELDIPPMELCTDNAAMIASAARFTTVKSFPAYLQDDVYATGEPRPVAA